jgi:hypothetical protein
MGYRYLHSNKSHHETQPKVYHVSNFLINDLF